MKQAYNNKPFNGWISRDIEIARKRVQEDNKPCAILIISPPGRGKTTLAVHLAEEYQQRKIDFKKQLGNGFEDFNRVLAFAREDDDISVIIYDEGGDVDKRRWMSDTNYKIRRILQLYRGYKKLLIMCIQDFSLLDESVLNTEVFQLMYFIPKRLRNYAHYSCYSLNRMYWLLSNMKKLKNKSWAYSVVDPNYRGLFKNLDPERAKELEVFSLGGKSELLDVLGGVGDYEDIHSIKKITGMSISWCRLHLKKSGIKCAKLVNGKKHFPKGSASILMKAYPEALVLSKTRIAGDDEK